MESEGDHLGSDDYLVISAFPMLSGRCGADPDTRRIRDERNETVLTINIRDGVAAFRARAYYERAVVWTGTGFRAGASIGLMHRECVRGPSLSACMSR
jgi:hypothetical protein